MRMERGFGLKPNKKVVLGACSRYVDADGCPILIFDGFQARSDCLDCEFFIPISSRVVEFKVG